AYPKPARAERTAPAGCRATNPPQSLLTPSWPAERAKPRWSDAALRNPPAKDGSAETVSVSRTVGCSFADPTILPAEKTHCKLLPIDRKPLTMCRARLRSRFRSRLFARTLRPFASTARTGRRDSQSERGHDTFDRLSAGSTGPSI